MRSDNQDVLLLRSHRKLRTKSLSNHHNVIDKDAFIHILRGAVADRIAGSASTTCRCRRPCRSEPRSRILREARAARERVEHRSVDVCIKKRVDGRDQTVS